MATFNSCPSILVLLPYVDDFQYPCFSASVQTSSRHSSRRTSRPAVGTALSVLLILSCCWVCSSRLLLAMLFCHFVHVSEILLDILLVVVQVVRLCAPFRQSGFASFVDFVSSLASGCGAVSVLCLLASPPPALLCGSLLLRSSPLAPLTPLLDMRHLMVIGSR